MNEDEPHRLAAEEDDEDELLEEEKKWKQHVQSLRAQLAIVEKEQAYTQAAIKAIREYKNVQRSASL